MATRLDHVSRPAQQPSTASREGTATDSAPSTVSAEVLPDAADVAQTVPPARLVGATAVWLGLVFALCYFVLPALYVGLGVGGMGIFNFWPQFPAFVLVAAGVVALVGARRPPVTVGGPNRDPVFSATVGAFGMWAVLQNLLFPFFLMNPVHLVAHVLLSGLKSVMVGTMMASFTKDSGRAFQYGVGFQLAIGILSFVILSLV